MIFCVVNTDKGQDIRETSSIKAEIFKLKFSYFIFHNYFGNGFSQFCLQCVKIVVLI